ncbi:loricrin [Nematostella vectensis]|uniref:loricrin n=1 Tax=Nematostella vectensis TaxID=45351 RepID=UPI002076F08C|nr:loricrin [Nematostella vectensis]
MHYRIQSPSGCGKCPKFHKTRTVLAKGSDKIGVTSRFGEVKTYMAFASGRYRIETGGGQGGTHNASYGTYPGIFPGGKGATMEGIFQITVRTELKIVIGKPGGNSVEIRGGRKTNLSANELGMSVEDNAGTGGGGGSFVYTSAGVLLVAAGGGGGGSSGFKGVDGQATENGAASKGRLSYSRAGGSNGNPGVCNRAGGNYHGGVGAGWNGAGCNRTQNMHGEAGGARAQGWVGGRAGNMNSGYNGGPSPGAVGGFGGGGGGSEDNGASGGGGGYSGGGSGITWNQAGGGGGSYCAGSSCKGVTGGNSGREGYVQVTYLGP